MKIKCIKLEDMKDSITEDDLRFKYLLPNEIAEIDDKNNRIIKDKDIIESSKFRKKVVCPIFYECGGCDFLHIDYEHQLDMKQAYIQNLFDEEGYSTGVNPIIKSDKPLHYRHKAVLSAKTSKQKLRLGLYREHTREVLPFLGCFIHDREANNVLKTIEILMNKYKIGAYDLKSNTGILKHVLIRKSFDRNEMMVVFVTNGNLLPNAKKISQELVKKHKEVVTTVQNIHYKSTHLVLLDDEKVVYGPGYLIDKIDDLSFRLSAKSFYQINPEQMFKLYKKAIEMADLSDKDIVLDTYSGIGTLSLLLSKVAKKVIAIEVNRDAHIDAVNNKRYNQISNIDFICDDVSHTIKTLEANIDVLFMDPTRDGSTKEFLDAVLEVKPKKIIYISCEPKTQVRDLILLKEAYDIVEIQPVDMFSQTYHVENIVSLIIKV
jgi:23S rRNA (uracil1939-C5)-methyltransferase